MFRRLVLEEWNIAFTLIAFVTALTIFVYIVYWVLRMRKPDVDRIAQLPLEEDSGEVDAKSGKPVASNIDGNAHSDKTQPPPAAKRPAEGNHRKDGDPSGS